MKRGFCFKLATYWNLNLDYYSIFIFRMGIFYQFTAIFCKIGLGNNQTLNLSLVNITSVTTCYYERIR